MESRLGKWSCSIRKLLVNQRTEANHFNKARIATPGDKCRVPSEVSVSKTIVLRQECLINARLQLLQSIQGHPHHEILDDYHYAHSQSILQYFKCTQTKKCIQAFTAHLKSKFKGMPYICMSTLHDCGNSKGHLRTCAFSL